MEDSVETKVLESLDVLSAYIGQAADFVAAEAPLLATDIIRWGIVSNIFEAFVGAVMLFTAYKIVRWINFTDHEAHREPEFAYFAVVPIGVGGFLLFTFAVLGGIKALFAPRLYILERIASMVSGHS